jgi:hypothetical protein
MMPWSVYGLTHPRFFHSLAIWFCL